MNCAFLSLKGVVMCLQTWLLVLGIAFEGVKEAKTIIVVDVWLNFSSRKKSQNLLKIRSWLNSEKTSYPFVLGERTAGQSEPCKGPAGGDTVALRLFSFHRLRVDGILSAFWGNSNLIFS